MKKLAAVKETDKNETIQKLSDAIFELEASKGHLLWKVTDVVRKTKLSRSLVYRYLGSSKNEMLLSALRNFIADFYRFEPNKKEISFEEIIFEARLRVSQKPEAILFYQKWRAKDSWLKQEFVTIEKKFQKQLKKSFPALSEIEIIGIHAMIHGLVTAPFLTPEQASQLCKKVLIEKLGC